MKKHNLPLSDELLIESNLSTIDGREKMLQLLSLEDKPDAVYVAGDYAALGALQILNEKKIKVPEEIALVGFGNEPFSSMVTPSITSIEQHSEEIGKQAAYVFLEHIKKDVVKQTLTKKILDVDLLIRDSSNKKKF